MSSFKRYRLVPTDEAAEYQREKQLLRYNPALRAATRAEDEKLRMLFDENVAATLSKEERLARYADAQRRLEELIAVAKAGPAVVAAPAVPEPVAAVAAPGPVAGRPQAGPGPSHAGPGPAPVDESAMARIVAAVPEKSRTKAKDVLRELRNDKRLGFDKDLHVVIDGKPIADSNFADIMHDAFSNKSALAAYSADVASVLGSMNFPKTYFSNNRFKNLFDVPRSTRTVTPLFASGDTLELGDASFFSDDQEGKGGKSLRTRFSFKPQLAARTSHLPKRVSTRRRQPPTLSSRYQPKLLRMF